eukprot:1733595-Rhodomonas_salina.1
MVQAESNAIVVHTVLSDGCFGFDFAQLTRQSGETTSPSGSSSGPGNARSHSFKTQVQIYPETLAPAGQKRAGKAAV